MFKNYSKLKEKYKESIRQASYTDIMIETLASMFTYEGMPETVDVDMLEKFLLLTGKVAFYEDNEEGGIICSTVELGGRPDVYGRGTQPITATLNGKTKTWTDKKGLVIGFNNDLKAPDLNIERFADMLSKVDLSLVYNVIYSRLLPMPLAKTNQQKAQIEKAIKGMVDGDLTVILSDNLLNEIENGSSGIELVNISDVNASDKIQYLAHFHDDLTRWFYQYNGMCTQGAGKMAQQTTDEINGGLSASFIVPLDRLRHREVMCDLLNKEFGLSTSVRFSDAWLAQWAKAIEDGTELDVDADGVEEVTEAGTEEVTEGGTEE